MSSTGTATGGAGTNEQVSAENRTIIEKGGVLSLQKFWRHLSSAEFTRERQIIDSMPEIRLFYLKKDGLRVRYNTHLTVSGTSTENERVSGLVVGIYTDTRTSENGLVVERAGRTIFIPANRVKTVEILPGQGGGHRHCKTRRTRRSQRKSRRHH